MHQFNKVWFFWLLCVCLWNFIWPEVDPIYDVIVAIVLSIVSYQLKKNKYV